MRVQELISEIKPSGAIDLSVAVPSIPEKDRDLEKIGQFNGYDVMMGHSGGKNITVYLLDHQHRTVYEIEGSYKLHSNGKTTFFIDTLSEGPDKIRLPGIKAWQFYKWLITDKDFILVSDDVQTAGGQAVWDTLIRDPAVGSHIIKPDSTDRDEVKLKGAKKDTVKTPGRIGTDREREYRHLDIDTKKRFMYTEPADSETPASRLVAYAKP